MKSSEEVKSNYEADSDDESFNSCVGYLQRDLYDDVLFHHAVVPKEVVEQDLLITLNDSFSSAYSHRSSQHRQPKNSTVHNALLDTAGNRNGLNADVESCTSSHLLSNCTSNDDDLSFITDDTSYDERMGCTGTGLSVVSPGEKEERESLVDYDRRESLSPADSTYFDEWSMMSHPDDDIIDGLADLTSAKIPACTATPTYENPDIISFSDDDDDPPIENSDTGYFAMSSF